MSQIKAEISLRTNVKLNFHKNVGCQWYQWIPDFYNIRFWANLCGPAQILCYKNQGIHWYHCNPTFLWQINFTLVRRLISALIWDISGLWNRSDGRDFREKRIDISRFLALYIVSIIPMFCIADWYWRNLHGKLSEWFTRIQ